MRSTTAFLALRMRPDVGDHHGRNNGGETTYKNHHHPRRLIRAGGGGQDGGEGIGGGKSSCGAFPSASVASSGSTRASFSHSNLRCKRSAEGMLQVLRNPEALRLERVQERVLGTLSKHWVTTRDFPHPIPGVGGEGLKAQIRLLYRARRWRIRSVRPWGSGVRYVPPSSGFLRGARTALRASSTASDPDDRLTSWCFSARWPTDPAHELVIPAQIFLVTHGLRRLDSAPPKASPKGCT